MRIQTKAAKVNLGLGRKSLDKQGPVNAQEE